MSNTTQQSAEQILNGVDSGTVDIIREVAQHIDLSWFEWSLKLAIAAIIILCFKEIIFSAYRYLMLRLDKHISIGTIVKFNHGVYGKIKDYNLRTIHVETKDGIVKIPLEYRKTLCLQITDREPCFNFQTRRLRSNLAEGSNSEALIIPLSHPARYISCYREGCREAR